jgi:putative peptide zinc metalloprotease protein
LPGPTDASGAPTWTLQDPIDNRFFQISWPAFEILSRWHLNDPTAILADIRRNTTLTMTNEDFITVLEFVQQHHLTVASSPDETSRFQRINASRKLGAAKWLLHHYLFIRIPLFRPMPTLAWLSPRLNWLFHPRFWWGMAGVALVGLYLAAQQWDSFVHTFSAYSGLSGLLGVGIALSLAKILHEFGHALTAYRHGCRVPAMGIAFLVLWPVLYTDTNEAWKLTSRRQRLQIGAAGMAAELALAACATLLWNFLPDGPLRAGVFLLATSTWLLTLAINVSPFMRFDGYFLLSDWLNLPNLHERAFAFGRWYLRECLFGWGEPQPEPATDQRRRFLIAFAIATWLYRLVVFLSIALLVYHAFFKALGVLLFAVELGWFVALPVYREVGEWWRQRDRFSWRMQTKRSAFLAACLLGLLFIPWQRSVHAPAVLSAAQFQRLYAAAPARVVNSEIQEGQQVQAGQVLAELVSPELNQYLAMAQVKEQQLRWQLEQQSFVPQLQESGIVLRQRWEAAKADLKGAQELIQQLRVVAPFAGMVTARNPALAIGVWIPKGEMLFEVVGPQGSKVEAYVGEAQLHRLHIGEPARFVADRPGAPAIDCQIGATDRLNLATLDQAVLASPYGGPIAAQRNANGLLIPQEALFRVRLSQCQTSQPPAQELLGSAVLEGRGQSVFMRGWLAVVDVLRAEGGL